MNTESVDLRKVEFGKIEKVGDFTFDDTFTHIYIWLPGVSGPDCCQIRKDGPGGSRVWAWDGNQTKPTLTPSIHALGQWHGWLRDGRLVSC
jgi:hypothetical protein